MTIKSKRPKPQARPAVLPNEGFHQEQDSAGKWSVKPDPKTYDPADVSIAWDKSGATLTPADGVRYEAFSLLLTLGTAATVPTADALVDLMRSVVREEMAAARQKRAELEGTWRGDTPEQGPMRIVERGKK